MRVGAQKKERTELGELLGDFELFFTGQRGTGRLFTIAEGGVKDANVVWVVNPVGDVFGPGALGPRLRLRAYNECAATNAGDIGLCGHHVTLLGSHKGCHIAEENRNEMNARGEETSQRRE